MRDKYEIEKGIPPPKLGTGRGRIPIYPFGQLKIGESFAFPPDEYEKILTSMISFQSRHFPLHFRISKIQSRCWRLDDRSA